MKFRDDFFAALEELEIPVPSWAALAFFFTHRGILDVTFFETGGTDFVPWYSRAVVNGAETKASFRRENGVWVPHLPPTLIGVNLRTTLRNKV